MKVLLCGHALSPIRGSEPGFTWNWAWTLSRLHEVWVLSHPHYRDEVEEFLKEHPNPKLHISWIVLPAAVDPWRPARGETGLRLHYVAWQHVALRRARELHRQEQFDVAHHVSWGTVGVAPLLWRLPIPFVWGPIGGGQTAPPAFRKYFGGAWKTERLRALRLRLTPHAPGIRRAVRASALLFASNEETRNCLRKAGAERVDMLPDCGVPGKEIGASPRRAAKQDPRTLTALWAGRFEYRKGLPLVLEALASLGESPIRLLVAGDGPLDKQWRQLVRDLQIGDKVRFLGRESWIGMAAVFDRSDCFIFSSLRDTFGSVVLEAMARALPVIVLDHQGMQSFIPPGSGIKVPVRSPESTVRDLAAALRFMLKEPEKREAMSAVALEFARKNTWETRAVFMSDRYREAEIVYQLRQGARQT